MKTTTALFYFLNVLLAVSSLSSHAATGHTISRLSHQNDGAVRVEVAGDVPGAYRNYYDLFPLEVSNDLTHWSPWITLLRTNWLTSSVTAVDSTARGLQQRFYRTPTNQFVSPIPRPAGIYTVGTVSRIFTDASRSNRYQIKTNSSFMVQFWYPASPQKGVVPEPYIDPRIARSWSDYYSLAGVSVNGALFKSAFSHALPDVPIAIGESAFPVIIFSHGYQCIRTISADVMANLASHGYIAVAIDHLDAWASVFPDGRIVRGNAPDRPVPVRQVILQLQSRVRDIRFVIDELARLNLKDDFFRGRLDLDELGIFGHSFGGATAVDVCAADIRFKAGLSLDGGGHTNLLGLQITQPFLIASGPDDPARPYRAAFRSLFDQLDRDAYWFRLRSAEHFDFVESPWFAVAPDTTKVRAAMTLRQYVLSFFNKYLRHEDDHLLDGPSNDSPDVDSFLRK